MLMIAGTIYARPWTGAESQLFILLLLFPASIFFFFIPLTAWVTEKLEKKQLDKLKKL